MAPLRGVESTVKYKSRIQHITAKTDPLRPCASGVEAARQSGGAMLVFVGQEKTFQRGRRTPCATSSITGPRFKVEANSSGWHLRRVGPTTWTSPVCQSEA